MSQGLASDDVLERRQGAETGREPDIDGLVESRKGSNQVGIQDPTLTSEPTAFPSANILGIA